MGTVPQELDELLCAVEKLGKYEFEDPAHRRRAMRATRTVSDKLQLPFDKILEMWGAPSKDAAVKVCIDVDLFSKWKAAGKVQTVAQLAKLTGVQEELIGALLKHLATWHIIVEEDIDTFSQTEFSMQLIRPEIAACVGLQFDGFLLTFPKLPSYLKSVNYVRPTDVASAPVGYAMNFAGTVFEYMQLNPHFGQSLDLTLKGYAEYRGSWLDVYPSELLLQGAEHLQTLVVDVGGGLGQDMQKLRQRHPRESKDRLVLQEQAHIIEKIDGLDGVRLMQHDFLTEQPLKGARAYYLHQILHDWPDDKCRQILECLKPAIAVNKEVSRILINEMVVPEKGASMDNTAFDMIMMAMFSARERGERKWRELIAGAGLKLVKFWSSPLAVESVIEIALA